MTDARIVNLNINYSHDVSVVDVQQFEASHRNLLHYDCISVTITGFVHLFALRHFFAVVAREARVMPSIVLRENNETWLEFGQSTSERHCVNLHCYDVSSNRRIQQTADFIEACANFTSVILLSGRNCQLWQVLARAKDVSAIEGIRFFHQPLSFTSGEIVDAAAARLTRLRMISFVRDHRLLGDHFFFVMAAIRFCGALQTIKLSNSFSINAAVKIGTALDARANPLQLIIYIESIQDGDGTVALARCALPSPGVSVIELVDFDYFIFKDATIIDLLDGTRVEVKLVGLRLGITTTQWRRLLKILRNNSANVTTLKMRVNDWDAEVGCEMNTALASNDTLREILIDLRDRTIPQIDFVKIADGLAQNLFINSFGQFATSCDALRFVHIFPRNGPLEFVYVREGQQVHWHNDPFRPADCLTCFTVTGLDVQRQIDEADSEKTHFVARRCDFSGGMPRMRGMLAGVRVVTLQWCVVEM